MAYIPYLSNNSAVNLVEMYRAGESSERQSPRQPLSIMSGDRLKPQRSFEFGYVNLAFCHCLLFPLPYIPGGIPNGYAVMPTNGM